LPRGKNCRLAFLEKAIGLGGFPLMCWSIQVVEDDQSN
jgi:hypothetical protein